MTCGNLFLNVAGLHMHSGTHCIYRSNLPGRMKNVGDPMFMVLITGDSKPAFDYYPGLFDGFLLF